MAVKLERGRDGTAGLVGIQVVRNGGRGCHGYRVLPDARRPRPGVYRRRCFPERLILGLKVRVNPSRHFKVVREHRVQNVGQPGPYLPWRWELSSTEGPGPSW